jgi:hypothetical protein
VKKSIGIGLRGTKTFLEKDSSVALWDALVDAERSVMSKLAKEVGAFSIPNDRLLRVRDWVSTLEMDKYCLAKVCYEEMKFRGRSKRCVNPMKHRQCRYPEGGLSCGIQSKG